MVIMGRFSTCNSVIELEKMELDDGQLETMQTAVKTLIELIGENPSREGLVDTPRRVAKAWLDLTGGGGPQHVSQRAFGSALFHEPLLTTSPDGIVLVRDIAFACLNQHTLLPIHGRCHVAYIPQNGVILGLSKLARATRCLSGRIQSEEQLATDLMESIRQEILPRGVCVVVQAVGVGVGDGGGNGNSLSETSAVCGCFADPLKRNGLYDEVCLLLQYSRSSSTTTMPCGGTDSCHHHDNTDTDSRRREATTTTTTTTTTMTAAVEALLRGVGEDPEREGLKGSALRYVMWLQHATAGYRMRLPSPLFGDGGDGLEGEQKGERNNAVDTETIPCGSVPSTPDVVSTTSESLSSSSCGEEDHHHQHPHPPSHAVGTSATHPTAPPMAVISTETTPEEQDKDIKRFSAIFSSQCEHHLLPFYGTVNIAYKLSSSTTKLEQQQVEEALAQVVHIFAHRLQVQERLTQQIADGVAAVLGSSGSSTTTIVVDVLVVVESAHMCMVARGVEEHVSATMTTAARGGWAHDGVGRSRALKQVLLKQSTVSS